MSTSVSWPPIGGTSYSIPASGELNWPALSNFLIALGNNAQSTANTKLSIRVATTSPVTVASATDTVIVTDLSVAGAVAVTLPAGVTGQCFFIVDGKGDANTNNITITPAAGTINGAATYVINKARAGVLLGYNGTAWTVLSEFSNIAGGTIPRSSIAPGTANQVVINDGSGNLSSEATLAKTRGGTGADNSSVTFPSTGTIPTLDSADVFTNKTIDGDDNTVQDLAVASLKTEIANADLALVFDATGAPIAGPVNLATAATGVLATANGGTGQNSTATYPASGAVAVVPSSGVVKSNGSVLSSSNVDLTSEVTGTLPLGSGGTGQTTANAALNALLPTQTGNAGKVLQTDATNTSWATAATLPVSAADVTGSSGGSTPAAGRLGEIIASTISAVAANLTAGPTAGATSCASLTLTDGIWDVRGGFAYYSSTNTNTGLMSGGIELYNSTDATGINQDKYITPDIGTSGATAGQATIGSIVTISSSKTIQLRIRVDFTSGSPSSGGFSTRANSNTYAFYAVRVG